ncbi:MAG: YidC/Oxa1 family membrane protein insertase [Actinobacteria bacterium]|nr:YidC/Oxa1 family membrane protein insertase [Actinomycetota bacterium]
MSWLVTVLKPIETLLSYVIEFFYRGIPSYGIGIILLTLVVRTILLPLTISQTRSMARMQMLQPELKEIQKQYKGDQQKMQQEVMAFYKKNNVNPLSGCLPLLLQMPVFFALFQLLRDLGVKVLGVGEQTIYKFLWMDLTKPDPFYILVILMVGTMILTSKMTQTDMTRTGGSQALMTYLLPVVFGFISIRLQSGILIYWVTTNVWSIGQQWFVNKLVIKEKGKTPEKKKETEKSLPGPQTVTKIIKPKSKKRRKR